MLNHTKPISVHNKPKKYLFPPLLPLLRPLFVPSARPAAPAWPLEAHRPPEDLNRPAAGRRANRPQGGLNWWSEMLGMWGTRMNNNPHTGGCWANLAPHPTQNKNVPSSPLQPTSLPRHRPKAEFGEQILALFQLPLKALHLAPSSGWAERRAGAVGFGLFLKSASY